ncbi:hypothetical protein OSTOST_15152 [Ostertagia ostertagi]
MDREYKRDAKTQEKNKNGSVMARRSERCHLSTTSYQEEETWHGYAAEGVVGNTLPRLSQLHMETVGTVYKPPMMTHEASWLLGSCLLRFIVAGSVLRIQLVRSRLLEGNNTRPSITIINNRTKTNQYPRGSTSTVRRAQYNPQGC